MKLSHLIIISGLVLFLAGAFPTKAEQPSLKIGAVNMTKIFTEYYKTKKADAELKERAEGYGKELREKASELQRMEEEGKKLQQEAENPAFTDEKKSEKRKALETKLTEYRFLGQTVNDMKQSRQRELKEHETKVRNAIVEEITKIVQEKAKRDGFSLVIDKAGLTLNGVSAFIYVQDSMDITGDVIKTLNATAPASTEKAKEKKKE